MRSFENYNPIAIALYFLLMSSVIMFSQNPILLLLGFVGAFGYILMQSRGMRFKSHLLYFILFFAFLLSVFFVIGERDNQWIWK